MKYISKQHMKHISKISRMARTLLATVALCLLATACTDDDIAPDLPFGDYQDGDPVTLTFTVSVPQAEEVAVSRALSEAQENTLNELALLVYSSTADDATLQQGPYYIDSDELEDVTASADGLTRKRFTVTLQASTATQAIYLVANANAALKQGLDLQTATLSQVRALTETATSATYFSMSGLKQLPIPHADLLTQDFPLHRNAAKVTLASSIADERFTLTGFCLYNAKTEGSILAGADATQSGYTLPKVQTPKTGTDPTMTVAGSALYTYPTQNAWGDGSTTPEENTTTPKENTTTFLLIEGTYVAMEGSPAQTCYWHADLADAEGNPVSLQPNHHYAISLTGDIRPGYATKKAAIRGAQNIHITIVDTDLNSHNMASDGLVELSAETDTLRITEVGEDVTAQLHVTAKLKEDDAPGTLTSVLLSGNDWFTVSPGSWIKLDRTQVSEGEHNHLPVNASYYQQTLTVSPKVNNTGEHREALLKLTCQGVSIYVVVVHEPEFSAHLLFDAKGVELRVRNYERDDEGKVTSSWEGGGEGTRHPYWTFLQGDNNGQTNPALRLYGIQPEDMGGKVRTEGFHAPMSDFQQFVYTVRMPQIEGVTKWEVQLDEEYDDKLLFWYGSEESPDNQGTTTPPTSETNNGSRVFTFTNSLLDIQIGGKANANAYRCGKDAFRIILTYADGHTETYAYDLYHTGVFNYENWTTTENFGNSGNYFLGTADDDHPAGWYYYEVIPMGTNFWLDRNLGARSAGYAVKDFTLGTSWPYDNNALGGWYQVIATPDGKDNTDFNPIEGTELEKIAPRGFRVPTVAEFQTMTADRRFRMENVTDASGSHWEAAYHTGNADQGTVYFPLAGMYYDGQPAGNASTGYYWTQTEALGASGTEAGYWAQSMQLAGSSTSTGRFRIFANDETNPTGMSVRCVYNSRVAETLTTYQCYVKGYTHVFLYAEDAQENRTYLNAWPGQAINIDNDAALQMYKTFTYQSTVKYEALGMKLKVVFVHADDEGNVKGYAPASYATKGGLDFVGQQKYDRVNLDHADVPTNP